VGEATKLTNEASLGLLAGASTGSVSGGERAFGSAATPPTSSSRGADCGGSAFAS